LNREEIFMKVALQEAKLAEQENEVPIGAVIVFENQIIARAGNRILRDKNPVNHAEILVIQNAAKFLGYERLYECELFVTLEPCAMCAGAAVLARLKSIYYGASDPKAGALRSIFCIADNAKLNHRCQIISGILETECSEILTNFFRKLRIAKNER